MAFVWTTTQVTALKTLTETIKEFIRDVNFHFFKDRVTMNVIDKTHTVLVSFAFRKDQIEKSGKYSCTREVSIGINLASLNSILKVMDPKDTLTLSMNLKNPDSINIKGENTDINQIKEFDLDLLDIDVNTMDIPTTEFDRIISMESAKFQQNIKDLETSTDGQTIMFDIQRGKLTLQSKGEGVTGNLIIPISDNEIEKCTGESVRHTFKSKFLHTVCKATKLSHSVIMRFKNQYPLIIEYDVENLGVVRFCIAPQVDDLSEESKRGDNNNDEEQQETKMEIERPPPVGPVGGKVPVGKMTVEDDDDFFC